MQGKPIRVVCALIKREDLYLIAQRSEKMKLPLQWEFPGGKVNSGEYDADALVREIKEELNCTVQTLTALPEYTVSNEHYVLEMVPFVCSIENEGEPVALEHKELRWVTPEQMSSYNFAVADLQIIKMLQK